jgi:hypothetical protein
MHEPRCCEDMRLAVTSTCEAHPDCVECPIALVDYTAVFDEHGLIIRDGG